MTFVVPGALAVAVAVIALSGGLRGLGAVGQVVTGPEVPAAAVTGAKAPASRVPARLPTVPRAPAAALFAPGVAGPAPVGAPAAPVTTRPVGTVPPPRRGVAPGGSAPAAGGAPSSAPPPSNGSSDPVHQLGASVANQVGQAPPPAGPAGHDAITAVLGLIPPLPRAAAGPHVAAP